MVESWGAESKVQFSILFDMGLTGITASREIYVVVFECNNEVIFFAYPPNWTMLLMIPVR